ncbi:MULTISPECIES: YihY/virulence factor BrkB family protein [unclassified Streptomyces]|uniref:YihY/virulence factor BrkB family protein n=1 Tax=unclassified Streptomyces TaxID=2593676 RepID=UPI00099C4CE1|nr:YihY/virulence factor BrkB family protein [Streptomyces sp. CNQ-509]
MTRSDDTEEPSRAGGPGPPPEDRPEERPRERPPAKGPTDLSGGSWWAAVKRTPKEYKDDGLSDWAAALTYYGVLAIFPGLLALVSIVGLIGDSAIDPLIDNVATLAPGATQDILTTMLEQLKDKQGEAGIALIISVALALWSASGYVAGFMRAANTVYDVPEGRPVWKTMPTRLAITVVLVLLTGLISVGVVFTGTLARRAGDVLGLSDTAVTVWNWAKWPVLVILVSLVIAVLYWAAPNIRHSFRWVTPGSLLAVLIWLLASAAFGLYVANFGSYNKTYGSFAAIIIFLIWLWISNIAALLGLELNAELERGRALETGHPPEAEPYAEPRDTRKLKKKETKEELEEE